jgi:hypothetical protein
MTPQSYARRLFLLSIIFACAQPTKSTLSPVPDSKENPSSEPSTQAKPTTQPAASLSPPSTAKTPALRPCNNSERLDKDCECESDGRKACFDICCTSNAGCAHPYKPGGLSACLQLPISTPPKPTPIKAAPDCKDGDFLSSGCVCQDKTCMDICCVGSICSHASSPEGGFPKCINRK